MLNYQPAIVVLAASGTGTGSGITSTLPLGGSGSTSIRWRVAGVSAISVRLAVGVSAASSISVTLTAFSDDTLTQLSSGVPIQSSDQGGIENTASNHTYNASTETILFAPLGGVVDSVEITAVATGSSPLTAADYVIASITTSSVA